MLNQKNIPGWRSHGVVFEASSASPNITVVGVGSSNQAFSITNVTLIELCSSDILWPPTETCLYNSSSPEKVVNGNFAYWDFRYPSQLSYWNTSAPGLTDNALVLPNGGNTVVDASNTVGVGFIGLNPRISQVLYGLDTSKSYSFSFWMGYRIGGSPVCNFTASLDDIVIFTVRPPASLVFQVQNATVTPTSSEQTLRLGYVCGANTGVLYKQNAKFTNEYLAIDDVSFLENS
jgi:hypothetical protein